MTYSKRIKKYLRPKLKYILFKIVYPAYYKFFSQNGVIKQKVVFIEPNKTNISNSMELIYKNLIKENNEVLSLHTVNYYSLSYVDKIKACLKVLKDVSDAKVIFIDEAFLPLASVSLRKESHIIQLWHGCGAFKKFGFSTADLIFGASRDEQLKYPSHKNTSIVTVSSELVREHYAEAMCLDLNRIIATGVSRTDVFYDKNFVDSIKGKIEAMIPWCKGKKIILYAPTFRGRVAKAKTPNALNIELLYYFLKDEYVLLIKHHPNVKKRPLIKEWLSKFAVDVTDSLSIDELICGSDICVSDYSSLVFEYSLFERPMIFFAYDLDEYFDWRGFYYKYDEFVPGPIVRNSIELLDAIRNIDTYDKQPIIEFKKRFMGSCDGNSTERIISIMRDYINE